MTLIRPAEIADFNILYTFINTLENIRFDEATQRQIMVRNLQNPDICYLLAFEDHEPAGLLSCHAQWLLHHSALVGEIQEMIVAENYRSQGIGKKLVNELLVWARKKGIVQLEVTSSKRRLDAHRFYLREGFSETHFKFTRTV